AVYCFTFLLDGLRSFGCACFARAVLSGFWVFGILRGACEKPTLRRPVGRGRVPLRLFSAPSKMRRSRAPTGAGAEAPHPWPSSRVGRSQDRLRSPAGYAHRGASRRSAAAFSLRPRAALS